MILFVDPGIDIAAVAVFDETEVRKPRLVGGLDGAAHGYIDCFEIKTNAKEATAVRCLHLFNDLAALVRAWKASEVVIEVPYRDGTYQAHKGRQATKASLNAAALAKLNRAIASLSLGAIAAGASLTEFPSKYGLAFTKKPVRHAAMNLALQDAGDHPIRRNADVRDAVFLGLFWLATQ